MLVALPKKLKLSKNVDEVLLGEYLEEKFLLFYFMLTVLNFTIVSAFSNSLFLFESFKPLKF